MKKPNQAEQMEEGGVVAKLPLSRARELGLLGSGRREWGWLNEAVRALRNGEVSVVKAPQGVDMATFRMRALTAGRRILRPKGWRLRTQTLGEGKLSVWKERLPE